MTRPSTPNILDNVLSLSGATPAPPDAAERAELAQTLHYDYSQFGEKAAAIRDHAIEIKRHERRANAAVVESGRHLQAVKESLPHGQWLDWLNVEFHMSDRTALTLMQIAQRFDGKSEIISDLSSTVLGLLASPSVPDEAVAAVVEASSNGTVSVAQAKQIIAEHKPPARLSDGDLTTIVQTWMAGFWRQPWPENPSHTNGTLWRELTAWMHENVRESWQEGQLKEVIKRLHYAHVEQWETPARPATTPGAMLAVWELQQTVHEVLKQIYGDSPQPYAAKDMRTGAQMRAGRFWLLCTQSLQGRQFRLGDLAQAINNVAEQMAQRATTVTPKAPPAGYTVPEAVEDKPLPDWATVEQTVADVVEVHGEPAPVAEPAEANFAQQVDDLIRRTAAKWRAKQDDLRFGAKHRIGQIWQDCVETLPDVPADDLAFKLNELARQMEPQAAEPVPVSQRADYESDEWYTPAEYIEAARQVMGAIDLDPASSELAQTVVRANVYLTRFADGLRQALWIHQRIWLNPPYSNPGPWIEKLVREHQAGPYCTEAIVLVNNATETSWFQLLLENFPVCLPARRIAFWRYDHANVGARQGQAFFYLGPNTDKFEQVFKRIGPILRRVA